MLLVVNGTYDDADHEDPGHPERPDRVTAARAGVADLHLGSDLVVVPSHCATRAELVRVHNSDYLEELSAFCYDGGGDIDADTFATFDSMTIARHAVGGGLAVIREFTYDRETATDRVSRDGHRVEGRERVGIDVTSAVVAKSAKFLEVVAVVDANELSPRGAVGGNNDEVAAEMEVGHASPGGSDSIWAFRMPGVLMICIVVGPVDNEEHELGRPTATSVQQRRALFSWLNWKFQADLTHRSRRRHRESRVTKDRDHVDVTEQRFRGERRDAPGPGSLGEMGEKLVSES